MKGEDSVMQMDRIKIKANSHNVTLSSPTAFVRDGSFPNLTHYDM